MHRNLFHGKIGKKFNARRFRMSTQKSRYKAKVDGNEYTIVGPKSQRHMQTVTEILNEQLEQLKDLTKGLDRETRAILIAINTVSDQLDLKNEIEELKEENKELQEEKKALREKQEKIETE